MKSSQPNPARQAAGFRFVLLFGFFLGLLTAAFPAEAPTLTLHGPDGQTQVVSRLMDVPGMMAKHNEAGLWRLIVNGEHELRSPVGLSLPAGQRLLIEGGGPEAGFELAQVPAEKAAIYLVKGSFEVRGLTLRHGPHWCVEVAQGVSYHLSRLHVLDARGGGIAVLGPLGVDQEGPTNNVIEHCLVERFNTLGAKWLNEGISLRDNQAFITANVVRDSPTETMGIHVRGAGNHVEGNLVQNVSIKDSGAIYLSGGSDGIYTAVGNVVRHNVVVDAQRGVYLDDGTCAAVVEQNYLVDSRDFAVIIGGGRDNVVRENVALRAPVFVHLDNRRTGWPALPEKAKLFQAARTRLKKVVAEKPLRDRLTAAGFNADAVRNESKAGFNQPEGNRVTGNVLMPPAVEIKLQNFAQSKEPFVVNTTDAALPNRQLPETVTDWHQLSARKIGIPGMPDVAEILKGVGIP